MEIIDQEHQPAQGRDGGEDVTKGLKRASTFSLRHLTGRLTQRCQADQAEHQTRIFPGHSIPMKRHSVRDPLHETSSPLSGRAGHGAPEKALKHIKGSI